MDESGLDERLEWPIRLPDEEKHYKKKGPENMPAPVPDNSPDPMVIEALKSKIIKIIQDPKLQSQTINSRGKTIQIQANIQLVGDKAIEAGLGEAAPFVARNCLEAMEYLLENLPQPRWKALKALAVAMAIKRHGLLNPAAAELGISFRAIRYLKDQARALGLPIDKYLSPHYWRQISGQEKRRLRAIEHEETTGMPKGDEKVQPNGSGMR